MKGVINRNWWFIIGVLVFSLLAACASQTNRDRQASIDVDTTIIYKREGGFAGISQEWVIHLDGTIEGPGDQALTVPPEDVQELVERGFESDFAALAAETAKTDICCDQFTYTITVISGDEEWRLITTDTADQSKKVTELFIMAQALIAEAQPVP